METGNSSLREDKMKQTIYRTPTGGKNLKGNPYYLPTNAILLVFFYLYGARNLSPKAGSPLLPHILT